MITQNQLHAVLQITCNPLNRSDLTSSFFFSPCTTAARGLFVHQPGRQITLNYQYWGLIRDSWRINLLEGLIVFGVLMTALEVKQAKPRFLSGFRCWNCEHWFTVQQHSVSTPLWFLYFAKTRLLIGSKTNYKSAGTIFSLFLFLFFINIPYHVIVVFLLRAGINLYFIHW